MIDFVHPATTRDETIVTLHSLLDRDVYRGGAIVVGPVRRGRGRRVRVERRVVPVSADPERRLAVLERELWRIAVENLNYSEQHAWAALAGARVTTNNWRRAKAMLQHDQAKELRRRFLLTCVQRNRNHQLRLKALAEIAALRDADAFDDSRRGGGDLAARRAARRRQGAAPGARRAADRPPRPGPGLGVAPGRDHPRAARGVRRAALAGDQAAAGAVRQLVRAGPRPQRAPHRPRRPPAGPPPGDRAAGRLGRPHARRPRRCCAAPACGWPASPPPSPASCFATSRGRAARRRRRRGRNGRRAQNGAGKRAANGRRTAPRPPTASGWSARRAEGRRRTGLTPGASEAISGCGSARRRTRQIRPLRLDHDRGRPWDHRAGGGADGVHLGASPGAAQPAVVRGRWVACWRCWSAPSRSCWSPRGRPLRSIARRCLSPSSAGCVDGSEALAVAFAARTGRQTSSTSSSMKALDDLPEELRELLERTPVVVSTPWSREPRLRPIRRRHGARDTVSGPHRHLPGHAGARLRPRSRAAPGAGRAHRAPRAGPSPGLVDEPGVRGLGL